MSRFGDLHTMLQEANLVTDSHEVVIEAPELKTLRAIAQEIVPAQGANTYIEFVSASVMLLPGTEVLTETADNIVVRYTDASGVIVSQTLETTGFIDQTEETLSEILPRIDPIVPTVDALNTPLVLHNSGKGEFGGNASDDAMLSVIVEYRVHGVV